MKAYRIQTSLHEFMNSITYREYLLRLRDLSEEWKHPSLDQQYMMQIAREVASVLAKYPEKIKIRDFKLTYEDSNKSQLSIEEQSALIKRQTMAALGMKV